MLRIIGTDREAIGLQNGSKGGLLLGTCWGTVLGPGTRGWRHGLSHPPSPPAWVGVRAVLGLQEDHQGKSRNQTPLGLGGPQGGCSQGQVPLLHMSCNKIVPKGKKEAGGGCAAKVPPSLTIGRREHLFWGWQVCWRPKRHGVSPWVGKVPWRRT